MQHDGQSGQLSSGLQRPRAAAAADPLSGRLREDAHQDGFEVAVEKVLERRQEVDGGALDQLPPGAADLLLRLAAFYQSVAW